MTEGERQLWEVWMGYEKMGIVIQLLSLREKNSARERERRINPKKKKKERKHNPIRRVVPKSSSLVRQSSEPPREKHTVEYLRGIFNKRRGKKELYWDQWPGGLYEFSLWSLITEKLRQMWGKASVLGLSSKDGKRDLMSTSWSRGRFELLIPSNVGGERHVSAKRLR